MKRKTNELAELNLIEDENVENISESSEQNSDHNNEPEEQNEAIAETTTKKNERQYQTQCISHVLLSSSISSILVLNSFMLGILVKFLVTSKSLLKSNLSEMKKLI